MIKLVNNDVTIFKYSYFTIIICIKKNIISIVNSIFKNALFSKIKKTNIV